MARTFTVYSDPGHAWGAVSIADAEKVGLKPADFSNFSYRRGDTLYLEEDGDLTKFAAAFKAQHGVQPKWRERQSNKRSRIRNYESIQ